MTTSLEKVTELLAESDPAQLEKLNETIERLKIVQPALEPERVIAALLEGGVVTPLQGELLAHGRSLLMGHYILVKKIGEGGMGTVYAARHRHMRRMVALKAIRPEKFKAPGAVERFQREIQIAAHLRHPNIVVAHDAGEAQGSLYLVMELIEGVDLSRRLQSSGVLDVPKALEVVRQTACGLAYLHSQNLVHRDIKPSNLMLDRQSVVKILDLGLSRMLQWSEAKQTGVHGEITATGDLMGSVDFMAPEQFVDARSVDARADLYSLGCTFYCLLAGKPPFSGVSVGEKVIAHRERAIPPLEDVVRDLPPGLGRLFQRLLAKDPDMRPRDAVTVIAEIDALGIANVARRTAALTPADSPPRFGGVDREISPSSPRQFASRRGVRYTMLAGAAAAIIAVAAFVAFHNGRPTPGADSGNSPAPEQKAEGDSRGRPARPAALLGAAEKTEDGLLLQSAGDPDGDAPSGATKKSPSPPPSIPRTVDPDREAALWALGLGGEVQFQSSTQLATVDSRSSLPDDAFRVQRVNLSGLSVAKADFSPLAALSELKAIDLGRTDVDDRCLRAIGQIGALTELSCMGAKITDAGLLALQKLKELKRLDLRGTQVTDAGIARLAGRHQIEHLWLGEGQVLGDAGAESLANMPSLKSLGLRNTLVTDRSIFTLKALENLNWLDLGGCQNLTDESAAALGQYRSLEHVLLDGVPVSAACITDLESKHFLKVDR